MTGPRRRRYHRLLFSYSATPEEHERMERNGEIATRFGWALYTIAALVLAFFFCSQGG